MPLNIEFQVDWPLVVATDVAALLLLLGALYLLFRFASGYTRVRSER